MRWINYLCKIILAVLSFHALSQAAPALPPDYAGELDIGSPGANCGRPR
jgi:hypothetical protein